MVVKGWSGSYSPKLAPRAAAPINLSPFPQPSPLSYAVGYIINTLIIQTSFAPNVVWTEK